MSDEASGCMGGGGLAGRADAWGAGAEARRGGRVHREVRRDVRRGGRMHREVRRDGPGGGWGGVAEGVRANKYHRFLRTFWMTTAALELPGFLRM